MKTILLIEDVEDNRDLVVQILESEYTVVEARVGQENDDHLLAVVPEFDLRVFQNPTGHDFARWTAPGEIRSEQLRGE